MQKVDEFKKTSQSGKALQPVANSISEGGVHFATSNGVFTLCGSRERVPPQAIPERNSLHFSTNTDLTPHLPEFNWIDLSTHPFLLLIPRWNVFKGSLFGCLDYRDGHFPYYRDGRDFRLARNVVHEWENLEHALKVLVTAMLEVGPVDKVFMSSRFSLWPFPASYGFKKPHSSVQGLQKAAASSRDSFLPLIAAGTLGLLWCKHREQTQKKYGWRERLQNTRQIHPEWFSAFERSYANDPRVLRAGGVVEADHPNAPAILELCSQLYVPVCLHWGPIGKPSLETRSTYIERYNLIDKQDTWGLHRGSGYDFPNVEQYWKLYRATTGAPLPADLVDTFLPDPTPPPQRAVYQSIFNDPDNDSPMVERGSGQLDGELWEDFFNRRNERNKQRIANASPGDQQKWLDREKAASRFDIPGRHGASVYYWDLRSGFRVRALLTRGLQRRYWALYSRNQKKYDPVADAWDLCTEFGDPDPDSDDDEDDPMDSGDEMPMPMMDLPAAVVDKAGGTDREDREMEEVPAVIVDKAGDTDREAEEGEMEEGEVGESAAPAINSAAALSAVTSHGDEDRTGQPPENEPERTVMRMDDIAYERYGFDPANAAEDSTAQESVNNVRQLLGNGRWLNVPANADFAESEPPRIMPKLRRFFYLLSKMPTQSPNLPGCDISEDSSYIWDIRNWVIQVTPITVDGGVQYVVRRRGQDISSQEMLLLLQDPVSVLQIVRCHWGPSLEVIADWLVSFGIPFHTLIPGPIAKKSPPAPKPAPRPYLGYRKSGYRPDANDFRAYERERDRFLRSNRGRAAILAGGLLSRLAMNTVQREDVVYGPDPDLVSKQGRCFWEYGGKGYWDDFLTSDEADLICGMYMVEKGPSHSSADEASHMSWWPRQSHFTIGGLNLGFWSYDCEKWFRNRSRECTSREDPLMSATQWRKAVSFTHSIPKTMEKNRVLAATFLSMFMDQDKSNSL